MVSDKLQKLNSQFFWFLAAGVLAFAFMLCWWSGGRGFYPSDSSIVFDGAWRILSGQVPYRDFISPVIVPLYLQALFFKILGVHFFALRFHAAFVNMLTSALCMVLLSYVIPGWRLTILAGGLLTGIWFYSFWGIPWYFQTSVFFGLIGSVLALRARTTMNAGRMGISFVLREPAFWSAPMMLLAFLSKQPTGSLFLAFPLILWLISPRKDGFWKLFLAYGLGFLVGALSFYSLISDYADARLFKYIVFDLPPGILEQLMRERYYLNKMMGLLLTLTVATLGPVLWHMGRFPQDRQDRYLPLGLFMATVGFHVVCIGVSTAPSFTNLPLVGVMLALALYLVNSACERMGTRSYADPTFWMPFILAGVMVVTGGAGLYLVSSARAKGHNASMVFMPPIESGPLKGVRWSEPISGITRQNVIDVINFVQHVPEPIYVWGGFSILYGISGHTSVGPVLWQHEGLCFPNSYNAEMQAIDLWTLRDIQAVKPRYVIGATKWLLAVDQDTGVPAPGYVLGQEPSFYFKDHPYFKETMRYLRKDYPVKHQRFGPWLTLFERKDAV